MLSGETHEQCCGKEDIVKYARFQGTYISDRQNRKLKMS